MIMDIDLEDKTESQYEVKRPKGAEASRQLL